MLNSIQGLANKYNVKDVYSMKQDITVNEAIQILLDTKLKEQYSIYGGSISSLGFNTNFITGRFNSFIYCNTDISIERIAPYCKIANISINKVKGLFEKGMLKCTLFYSVNDFIDLHFTTINETQEQEEYISFCFAPNK